MTGAAQPVAQRATEVAHAGARGAVGAMAMTGMRTLTENLGLVRDTPPEAVMRERLRLVLAVIPTRKRKGLKGLVTPGRRKAMMETGHIAFGVAAGAGFGVLPPSLRRSAWSGPVYGLVVWLVYELGVAPLLGLQHARKRKPLEHLSFAADHVLYGLVLSEARRPPHG